METQEKNREKSGQEILWFIGINKFMIRKGLTEKVSNDKDCRLRENSFLNSENCGIEQDLMKSPKWSSLLDEVRTYFESISLSPDS